MRLYNIYGRLVSRNVQRYRINWDKKSRSKIQFKIKQLLKPFWENQIVYEEFPVYGSKMKVDILNATKKVAVEIQGRQHSEFNKFFHKNSRTEYLQSIKRDQEKALWLQQNSFELIEITEEEIKNSSEEYLLKYFKKDL
jgi:very-short-patch-repair endonuclease